MRECDLLVVGAGVAGLTAGLFGAKYGLNTIVADKLMPGSQIINVENILNFPGFPDGISGAELGPIIQQQAMSAGAEFVYEEIEGVVQFPDHKMVKGDSEQYRTKAIIISAGSELKSLGIPGENEFDGRGVSHCASCDGPLYMKEEVAVIGAGDSGMEEALTLTEYTRKVYLVCKSENLTGHKALQDEVRKNSQIEILVNTEAVSIYGKDSVEGLITKNIKTNLQNDFPLSGVFVYVGLNPNSDTYRGLLKMDKSGHICVNLQLMTSIQGIFAAGDIREHSSSQLISAAGDGATAAISAFNFITSNR
ncbi:MAG: thioredoxin-disulfide reductase [Chloroflexi bacterium]|nr:thioredoxin-disulfide reductase [Chloroflexota bacterium]